MMKKLKIEKYIHNQLDESFTVPLGFIRILNMLLPRSAIESLAQKGLGLEKIVLANKLNEPYQTSIEVKEKGITKTVSMTLY